MKKILILGFIVFQSCKAPNDKFNGNWYGCNHNGNYQELLIKKDSLRLVLSAGFATSWVNYKVKSDTLYILNSPEWRDSTKAILRFNPDKTLSIKYTNTDFETIYKPLNSIVKNPDKYSELINETKNRSEKSECVNQ